MRREASIRSAAIIIESCLASSRVIRSFGANPVSGGRPASDRRTSIVVEVKMGDFGHDEVMLVSFVAEIDIKRRNMAEVIIRYRTKLKMAKIGLNFITVTIQPRWAIEEKAMILRNWV